MKFLILLFTLVLSFHAHAGFWIQDGSITNKKLGTFNMVQSTEIIYSGTGQTTPIDMATVVITTSGRPVMVRLMAKGYPGIVPVENFWVSRPSGGGPLAIWTVTRSGTNIYYDQSGDGRTSISNPMLGAVSFIDTPPAGTHTYVLKMAANAANTSINIQNAKFVAYEM